jgi:anti-sigma factor RsiW
MSCESTQSRLFAYLDEELDANTRREVERHLAECAECAGFAEALGDPVEDTQDWTRAVLRRIGAEPCAQAVDRLSGWVDGDLETVDTELVAGHVAHCGECNALARVLRAMRADLPELAEVRPDAAFLGDVLAATLRAEPILPWVARLDGWFAKLMQRPRIAWEGAFLATACLLLLVAFPGSPLAAVSEKALDLTRNAPNTIEQPFVAFRTNLNVSTQETWFSTRSAARSLAVRASAESGDAYRYARRGLGTLWDRFASDPLSAETQTRTPTSPNGESK